MTSLATNHFVLQEIIAKSGGIQPLIELMSKASLETKEYATRTLWHLAGNSEVGVVIAQAGGLTPLVELLSCEDEHLQELAAVVIGRLSRSNPIVSLTVAEAGGVSPLVALLRKGSSAAQQQAAAALAELGLAPVNRDTISDAGGIAMLVELLDSAVPGTPETAARALAYLARDARDTPDDGGSLPEAPTGTSDAGARIKEELRARLSGHGQMRILVRKALKLAAADEAPDASGGGAQDGALSDRRRPASRSAGTSPPRAAPDGH